MAAAGVVVIYTFTYRDAPEEFSQKYHFEGDAPSDGTGWTALMTELATLLAPATSQVSSIVRMYGYEDTDHSSVFTYDFTTHGGAVVGTLLIDSDAGGYQSGDVAYLGRWTTGRTSTKGKPIYLFKYWHGAPFASSDRDKLPASTLASFNSAIGNLRGATGAWPGIADKTGAMPVGWHAETYLTTRTLKRRGRRPT